VALSLAIRLVAAAASGGFHAAPSGDEPLFVNIGWNLVSGHGYSANAESPTSERAPGFPFLLASLFLLTGKNLVAARVCNIALSALTVGVLYIAACRLFGRRIGTTAGVLAAAYPTYVGLSSHLLSETLFLFLVSLVIVWNVSSDWPRATHLRLIGYGVLIGLAVLTRVEFILAIPFLMLALPRRNRTLPASAGRIAFVLGGLLLTVGPWVIRNTLVYRRVLLSNSLGQVLSGVYNDRTFSDPVVMGDWVAPKTGLASEAEHPRALRNEPGIRYLPEAQLSEYNRDLAVRAIRRHWRAMPRLLAAKLNRLFLSFGPVENLVRFGLLYFAAFGALVLLAARGSRAEILFALLATGVISALLLYASPRLRVATDAAILMLASAGLWEQVSIYRSFRHGNTIDALGK
jgi:4-amino-4-deoxy-L-arabinose transferase-like glycosyltransferase